MLARKRSEVNGESKVTSPCTEAPNTYRRTRMAKICVEIELDTETGEVMVGVCPPAEEAMEGGDGMQG